MKYASTELRQMCIHRKTRRVKLCKGTEIRVCDYGVFYSQTHQVIMLQCYTILLHLARLSEGYMNSGRVRFPVATHLIANMERVCRLYA